MQANARFWVWENDGWVKLTLKPRQSLEHYRCSPTDEGWSAEWVKWEHCGDAVRREWSNEGRDCDGFLGNYGADFCPLENLAAIECDDGGVRPDWQRESSRQHDEYAVAAGY